VMGLRRVNEIIIDEFALKRMDERRKAFNDAVLNLLIRKDDGKAVHGKVCICCDRLLGYKEDRLVSLKTFMKYVTYLKGDESVPVEVRSHYVFRTGKEADDMKLRQALLSPRSLIVQKSEKKRALPHVMCCKECRSGLDVRRMKEGNLPRFAIANGWWIGDPPECLLY
jgi:hypothetical protein